MTPVHADTNEPQISQFFADTPPASQAALVQLTYAIVAADPVDGVTTKTVATATWRFDGRRRRPV